MKSFLFGTLITVIIVGIICAALVVAGEQKQCEEDNKRLNDTILKIKDENKIECKFCIETQRHLYENNPTCTQQASY